MRRTLAAFAILSGAALLGVPAVAQDARLRERLAPPVLDQVTRVLDSTRAVGLPTEPLVDKALEGASKRASGDRIVAAVRTLAGDLGSARAALGRSTPESELIAGAAAIRAGAKPQDLARLRAERREALTVPLAVLANLMARGVPSDTASAVIHRLLASGAPDTEFTDLQANVERDIGTGASPGAAAAVRGGGNGGGSPAANPGNPGAGNPSTGNPSAGNPGRGNPGGSPGASPSNPGRGGGPPVASPGNGGRGRGQPSPGPKPKQPKTPQRPR